MTAEIDFPLKPFLTRLTGKWLVTAVLPHMSNEIRRLTERFAAHDALVGLLTWWIAEKKREDEIIMITSQS